MDDAWGSLLVAVVGGLVVAIPAWLQVRRTMRTKMEEHIAVRRVDALIAAQDRLTRVPVGHIEAERAQTMLNEHHDWFVQNSPLLSGELRGKWLSLRAAISHAMLSRTAYLRRGVEDELEWGFIGDAENDAAQFHDAALSIIKKEMNTTSVRLEQPWIEREQRARSARATTTMPEVGKDIRPSDPQ